MLKQGLILVSLLVLAQAKTRMDSHWEHFKLRYTKNYVLGEEEMRRAIWESNHDFIQRYNVAYEAGNETYSVGENEYADLTTIEFARQLSGVQMAPPRSSNKLFKPRDIGVRSEVDWRAEGAVTPVKNQKSCGSCWAFSATGSLEGQHFKKTGSLVSLSEQNLVDCSSRYGNAGCNGGLMDSAFEYVQANGGVDTEASYPYEARTKTCRFNAATVGATCTGYVDIKQGSKSDLMAAIASVGPVSVAIDASRSSFQLYRSGVYVEPRCSSRSLDHGVLAVGYGTDAKSGDYWSVNISWVTAWVEAGVLKMARNKSNQCGVATEASYPTV